MDINERVKNLYELAKKHPDDTNLQEAVAIIKALRQSQGSLKGWNERYRQDNATLKTDYFSGYTMIYPSTHLKITTRNN